MPSLEKPAIVLAPYGSLSPRALATYDQIRKAYEREFPGSPVRLAFTSQLMIKDCRRKRASLSPALWKRWRSCTPGDARAWWSNPCRSCRGRSSTAGVAGAGTSEAREQSSTSSAWRSACPSCRAWKTADRSPDPARFVERLWLGSGDSAEERRLQSAELPRRDPEKEAVLLVGHGTGHPADALYSLMARVLKRDHSNVFLGTMEGFPGLSEMVAELKGSGARKVRLLPFLLVAGGHAENDIAGRGPSPGRAPWSGRASKLCAIYAAWVRAESIVSIFLEHTRSALVKIEEERRKSEGENR